MNIFKAIYCNQYFELKQKGKEVQARYNGTILTSIALVLILFGTYIFLITWFPDIERAINRAIRKVVGRTTGRMMGKLIAFVFMVISYVVIRWTIGTQRNYEQLITTFDKMPIHDQEKISKKGLKAFIGTIVFIVISLIGLLVKTYIIN